MRFKWRRSGSVVAGLCLAVALGVTAIALTLVEATVLRPFGLKAADRLVVLWAADPSRPADLIEISLPNYLDWEQGAPAFQSMAAFGSSHWPGIGRLAGVGESFPVAPRAVSRRFFHTLGVAPFIGRDFTADDLLPRNVPPAILSHAFWQSQVGGNRSAIGATLIIDNKPHRIVGVMPRGFSFPDAPDVWISVERALGAVFDEGRMSPSDQRVLGVLQAVGRYAPGATRAQAQSELNTIERQITEQYSPQRKPFVAAITPFTEIVLGGLGTRVWIALAMTLAVLLFACTNVSAVRVAHLQSRAGELSARLCFGASRTRLFAQLTAEMTPLMVVSAVAGVGVAFGLETWLGHVPVVVSSGIDLAQSRSVTWIAIGGGALLAWVLVAIPAALDAVRRATPAAVTIGTRTVARGSRTTSGLLLAQAALAVCLVAMATGAFQMFAALARIDVGFATRGVTAIDVSVPGWKYDDAPAREGLERRVISTLKELPGVTEVAGVSIRPFRFGEIADGVRVRRAEDASLDAASAIAASRVVVSPGYFDAIGMTVRSGRVFTEADRSSTERIAVVTRSLATSVWGSDSPLGRHVEFATMRGWIRAQVVGVVEDVRSRVMSNPTLEVYIPARGGTVPFTSYVLRYEATSRLTDALLRGALRRADPDLVLERALTTRAVVDSVLAPTRLLSTAMAMLGVTGLTLLALGIFGAAATILRTTRREVGIRQAVGATPFGAARAPLRMLFTALLLGVLLGSVLAPGAVSVLASMGVAQKTGLTLAIGAGVLAVAVAALTAVAINVRRTTIVSPAELLRTE